MNNLEKLNSIFCEVFNVNESDLNHSFDREHVSNWDSVHQVGLSSLIEDEFDIMFDAEDIIALSSYENTKEVLAKYEIEL